MGTNLVERLRANKIGVFEYDTKSTIEDLNFYVKKCDFVIHLAGVNRADNPEDYIKGNVDLTRTILQALEKAGNTVPVLFSSSTHVDYDTDYGKSKRLAEELVINYSKANNVKSYVYRLTNVFGKGSRPNLNGVVGTFCYNIINDLPVIVTEKTKALTLIYINDLVDEFVNAIHSKETRCNDIYCGIKQTYKATLGEIVDLLYGFKNGQSPVGQFEKVLYDTYVSYLPSAKVWKSKRTLYRMLFKRPIDFFAALILLIIISPIFLVVALLVRIKHGRPIFFKQRRVGKNRKIFSVYKFRSMSNRRDDNGELLPDRERLTKFGKFIRKTSLDELPQLINILKGEMSFIGPRPRPTEECVFLTEEQARRFAARPGISGLAQVSGRNAITLDVVTEFDNKYIRKISAWGDIKICFQTVFVVLKRKNIDGNTQGQNATEYYGARLLRLGMVTIEEYDARIALAKSLKVGDTLPSFDGFLGTKAVSVLAEGFETAKNERQHLAK